MSPRELSARCDSALRETRDLLEKSRGLIAHARDLRLQMIEARKDWLVFDAAVDAESRRLRLHPDDLE